MFNYIKNKAFNFWYRDEIESEFYQAVKFNEFKKVEFLLEHRDADPNTKDFYDVTVLHLAAKNGNTEIITILMNAGANPQAIDYLGDKPMDYALASEKPSSAAHIAHIQNEMEEAESSIYLRKGEQLVEESWKNIKDVFGIGGTKETQESNQILQDNSANKTGLDDENHDNGNADMEDVENQGKKEDMPASSNDDDLPENAKQVVVNGDEVLVEDMGATIYLT
jgi:hypothetical protein